MEAGIIIIAIAVTLLISWAIAEFFGKAKHIGFGWTFALTATTAFIGGIIALLVSPSAKDEHTKGGKGYVIGSVICFIFGAGNIVMLNPLALGFLVLGLYLYKLYREEIINENPKFYFNRSSFPHNIQSGKATTRNAEYQYKDRGLGKDSSSFSSTGSNDLTISEQTERLKNLYTKGVLSLDEFQDKLNSLQLQEIDEEVEKSIEYKQLQELFSSGVLTKMEFREKVFLLKRKNDKYQAQQEKYRKSPDYQKRKDDKNQWNAFFIMTTIAVVVVIVWNLIWNAYK